MGYLLVIAATFGVMFVLDKGLTKLFRSRDQHRSGTAVRLKKHYGILSLALMALGLLGIVTYFTDKSLTLLLGAATVDAEPYYREKCEEIMQTRTWTAKQLEKLGFFVLPSDTNFLFAKTARMDGGQLYETLKSKGILVRHFSNPKTDQYNRITIGTKAQMETLIQTLKEVLL